MTAQLALDGMPKRPWMYRAAWISHDDTYRYRLNRRWGEGHPLVWMMLNPSTADATTDDATVRRVIQFSHDAGYRAATIVNLYALRATDLTELWTHPDPIGPCNDIAIACAVSTCDRLVCAWGANAPRPRVDQFLAGLIDCPLYCLGVTAKGYPRHPVRLAKTTELVPFDPWATAA